VKSADAAIVDPTDTHKKGRFSGLFHDFVAVDPKGISADEP